MDNDFWYKLIQIYVNTDDKDIIDTINTLLDNKNESHRMNEMPCSDQVGDDISYENFPNLKEGDLQSEIDNLVEYVDRFDYNDRAKLKGYKTTMPIRHIQNTDNDEKVYEDDVYLTVGNCYKNTNKIIPCYYKAQAGLYHMKYGEHWYECQEALDSENIEKFKTSMDIEFVIDTNINENVYDKTKLEVHTGKFTYIVALAMSDKEITVLLTCFKETTKERDKRRKREKQEKYKILT